MAATGVPEGRARKFAKLAIAGRRGAVSQPPHMGRPRLGIAGGPLNRHDIGAVIDRDRIAEPDTPEVRMLRARLGTWAGAGHVLSAIRELAYYVLLLRADQVIE